MEVITSIKRNDLPKDLNQYESVEHGQDSQDRVLIYGLNGEGRKERIKEDDLIKAYGHDPAEWDKAKEDLDGWIASSRVAYLESRSLPAIASPELLENRRLRAKLAAEKEKSASLEQKLQDLEEKINDMAGRLQLLEGGGEEPFQDTRSWREKTSDFLHGRSLHIAYRTHPIRETIVEQRDNRPKAVLAAGALALAGLILWRYTGSVDGLTDDQAQTLIDQQADIIDGQIDIQENQDRILDNQETIIDNQEAHQADMESQHTELSSEHNDIAGDIDQHINKNTQDHRELHGDIHPDPEVGQDSAENGADNGDYDDGDSSSQDSYDRSGSSGTGDNHGDIHRESLEFRGNTIWSDVEKNLKAELGHSPSDAQVSKATDHVLKFNNLTWDQARYLPVGYSYKMPDNLASLIN